MKFYFLIAFVWLLVLVISFIEFFYCTKTFNISNFGWSIDCTKGMGEYSPVFFKIRYAWTLTLPIAMLAMYISIFCSIRRKRQSILDQSRTNSNVKKSILFVTRYKANNGMRTDRREQLITSTVIPTISIALTKIHPISRAKVDNQ
ncbi:Octopamine receptor beta-3R [Dirofilaria immitis]